MNETSMSKLCANTPVVILAGGKGTRLQPYTTVLPKPLMPVGQYPILEILLRQLSEQGFRNVTLAVGHLAGIIEAYFKEGRDWGLDITYSHETTPLGTAGPIAKLARTDRSTLVLNGDLLTTFNFGTIVRHHHVPALPNIHQLALLRETRYREGHCRLRLPWVGEETVRHHHAYMLVW